MSQLLVFRLVRWSPSILLLAEQARQPAVGEPLRVDLLTAGSPIRRLVQRFLPLRTSRIQDVREELARSSGVRVERWFNAYRLMDYVGQGLTHSALPLELLGRKPRRGDPCTGICEHLLTPRFAWPFMHADYWGDARFLDLVAGEVMEPTITSMSTARATVTAIR